MRRGVIVVESQRRLVMDNCIGERTVLEQHIADVYNDRDVTCIGFEGGGKSIDRRGPVAAPYVENTALIMYGGPLGSTRSGVQCGAKVRERFIETAPFERRDAGLERRLGHPTAAGCHCEQAREERHPAMLHIDVITLFPEMFAPVIGLSIVGRAIERGIVAVSVHDLVGACEPGARADERPFGGGPGMVLRIEPLARLIDEILAAAPAAEARRIVLTSASGPRFGQAAAREFARCDRLILICGHYEGVDERIAQIYPTLEEFSLGDFVLTGGEIPAMAFLDATVRLVDGAISAASRDAESFTATELDYPAYTRPPIFRGVDVPAVLLSGDHQAIAQWRRQRSRERAIARQADPARKSAPLHE